MKKYEDTDVFRIKIINFCITKIKIRKNFRLTAGPLPGVALTITHVKKMFLISNSHYILVGFTYVGFISYTRDNLFNKFRRSIFHLINIVFPLGLNFFSDVTPDVTPRELWLMNMKGLGKTVN